MKPAAFDYVRAETVDEVITLLAEHGPEARVLAGGQSLMAMLNMRLLAPRVLIDISRCAGLAKMQCNDRLEIGAAVTQHALQTRASLGGECPLLAQALPHVAHMQIRSRGTVCGSITHADPSAELPLALATLNGSITLCSRNGRRTLAAGAFLTGMLSTARRDDELVECAHFPLAGPGERQGFAEFSRRHGDFALVAVAASVNAQHMRLGIGGVEDRPHVVEWPRLEGADLQDALNALAWSLEARDDLHASASLRRRLVRHLGMRLLTELAT